MKAKLIVVGGTTNTTEVNLRLPAVIGRGRSVQVTIPHSLVSRQHCEISESEGRLWVRDLDSLNGTYIGNERITEAFLEPGALLTIGTVTFRANYEIGCSVESVSDNSDETCVVDEPVAETDDSIGTDLATVPAKDLALREAVLPPRISESDDASEEEATEPMPDHADDASLESAAKESD